MLKTNKQTNKTVDLATLCGLFFFVYGEYSEVLNAPYCIYGVEVLPKVIFVQNVNIISPRDSYPLVYSFRYIFLLGLFQPKF